MEVRNNYSPAFTGIVINAPKMNRLQQAISRNISDMLDYTDEYVKVCDDVDVYFLPGKSEKSVIVKFMDSFSDMFYRRGKNHVQTTIDASANYSKSVEDLCAKLKGIDEGKYYLPEYDEAKFIARDTDLAKIDDTVYDELLEHSAELEETIGKEAADSLAIHSYQTLKKIEPRVEI